MVARGEEAWIESASLPGILSRLVGGCTREYLSWSTTRIRASGVTPGLQGGLAGGPH
ncbi:MAG: hypothetical protein ACJA0P_002375 [Planctomycetota bacterium]|jgi:hypothetical protein